MNKIIIKTDKPIKKGKYIAKPKKIEKKKIKIGKDYQLA
jgi:hypothetical protein